MDRRIVRSSARLAVTAASSLAWSLVLGFAAAPSAHAASDTTWDRLAMCESSQRWHIDTGNGYYGGLQIDPATWDEAGGRVYAPMPHQATRRQQINIAERILRMQGWEAWPQCARTLDLFAVPISTPYVVGSGDTLASIARRFALPGGWETVYRINYEVIGPDPDRLLPGTRLELPSESPGGAYPG
ncbi:MAG: LysM peptidoglycan-binding domain-containing protein [Streptomycetaceae bacterium]|nr:LysM peptidoglycan-binding domain-containing protein [Streptomycetaceae bacterium]